MFLKYYQFPCILLHYDIHHVKLCDANSSIGWYNEFACFFFMSFSIMFITFIIFSYAMRCRPLDSSIWKITGLPRRRSTSPSRLDIYVSMYQCINDTVSCIKHECMTTETIFLTLLELPFSSVGLSMSLYLSLCLCICLCIYLCVCVCICFCLSLG